MQKEERDRQYICLLMGTHFVTLNKYKRDNLLNTPLQICSIGGNQ